MHRYAWKAEYLDYRQRPPQWGDHAERQLLRHDPGLSKQASFMVRARAFDHETASRTAWGQCSMEHSHVLQCGAATPVIQCRYMARLGVSNRGLGSAFWERLGRHWSDLCRSP